MSINLKYGVDSNGRVVHVDEVLRGKNCNCHCPECNSPLIAKQGEIKTHHFAHQNGIDCEHAPETLIHLMSKQIIEEHDQIIIEEERNFSYDTVNIETTVSGLRPIPDVIISNSDEKFFVEIEVTNPLSKENEKDYKNFGVSVLVIDLSEVNREIDLPELVHEILSNPYNRRIIRKSDDTNPGGGSSFFKFFLPGIFLWFLCSIFLPSNKRKVKIRRRKRKRH